MSTARWTTPVNVTLIASLGNVANGGWATSGATFLDNGTNRRLYMDVDLVLASAVTAGSGAPRVDLYLVPVPDGTNAPTPPGTSAGATPVHYLAGSILANASASFTRGAVRGLILPPGKFLVLVQNNLGVAFGTGTHALEGYQYGEEAV
jgi:hypothetical protein